MFYHKKASNWWVLCQRFSIVSPENVSQRTLPTITPLISSFINKTGTVSAGGNGELSLCFIVSTTKQEREITSTSAPSAGMTLSFASCSSSSVSDLFRPPRFKYVQQLCVSSGGKKRGLWELKGHKSGEHQGAKVVLNPQVFVHLFLPFRLITCKVS